MRITDEMLDDLDHEYEHLTKREKLHAVTTPLSDRHDGQRRAENAINRFRKNQ